MKRLVNQLFRYENICEVVIVKIQRNTIYITLVASVFSVVLYTVCIFFWNPQQSSPCYDWHTFISNLVIGIWGGAIVSLGIALVSYGESRRKDMEAFMRADLALFEHCGHFTDQNSVEWFDKYCALYKALSDCWANIKFLFDPRRHRLFLKEYIDFYWSFMILTEDQYNMLRYIAEPSRSEDIKNKIKDIVMEEIITQKGICKNILCNNRLTHDKEIAKKHIDDIYRNKNILKKFEFNQTLVTKQNFILLEPKFEVYIKEFREEMDKSNSTELDFIMPIDDAEYLQKAGYISGWTVGINGQTAKVSCKFITDNYFLLKAKLKLEENS